MYKRLIRPILFRLDPEKAHQLVLGGAAIARNKLVWDLIAKTYFFEDKRLSKECFGLNFINPIGLAAGADKSCQASEFFSALGFGFLESVAFAYQPQAGNPKPRMFRLPQDQALINRMGFPSPGAEILKGKIAQARKSLSSKKTVFGINFAKSKEVPLDNAVDDYLKSFNLMKNLVDFVVVNVSSPNTPGLRDLQAKERLDVILKAIQTANETKLPILVKVAPDLSFEHLDDLLECAENNNLSGIVATNTTIAREDLKTSINEIGGLSGRPLFPRALQFVSYIRQRTQGRLKIIGVGGIFNSEHAIQMFKAGADLIELYSGMIYEGPAIAYQIKKGIVSYLEREGIEHINSIIGTATT